LEERDDQQVARRLIAGKTGLNPQPVARLQIAVLTEFYRQHSNDRARG
jgi:hypothetical protein